VKAIEKIFDVLPLPVLAGIAAIVFAAWLLKELFKRPDYAEVFRDPYFQSIAIVIILWF
jgi:hypothetical protein